MRVTVTHRSSHSPFGRFGGGWQWKLGIQAGTLSRLHGTIIVSVLVADVRLVWGV